MLTIGEELLKAIYPELVEYVSANFKDVAKVVQVSPQSIQVFVINDDSSEFIASINCGPDGINVMRIQKGIITIPFASGSMIDDTCRFVGESVTNYLEFN